MKPIFLFSAAAAFKIIDEVEMFQTLRPGTVLAEGGATGLVVITPTQAYNTN